MPCACMWATVFSLPFAVTSSCFLKSQGPDCFQARWNQPHSVCSIVSEPSSRRAVYFPGVQAQLTLPLGSVLPSTTCFLHLEVISIFPAHTPVVQNNSVSPPDLSAGTYLTLIRTYLTRKGNSSPLNLCSFSKELRVVGVGRGAGEGGWGGVGEKDQVQREG